MKDASGKAGAPPDGVARHLAEAIPHLVWMADAAGRVFWFNRRWYDFTGTVPEQMMRWGWKAVHDPAELPRVLEEYRRGIARGRPFEMTFPLRAADGSFRLFLTRVEPVRDGPGGELCWLGTNTDITRQAEAERRLGEETARLDTLNRVAALLAAELDLESLLQTATDASVALAGAEFGAFFSILAEGEGGQLALHTLSGAPRQAFGGCGMPRATPIFGPTVRGERVVRCEDVLAHPDFGRMAPHHGLPPGHLPVRSYLAVPVVARSGEVLGGMVFGHGRPGVFGAAAERLIVGIAAQVAVAIDNARLFQETRREVAERRRVEEQQRLLLGELDHRVKNTLATVQSIAAQTLRAAPDLVAFKETFPARLQALSHAHDLLNGGGWQGARLEAVLESALAPYRGGGTGRFLLEGPDDVWLEPQATLVLRMALHELVTNAAKHGALGAPGGRVELRWRCEGARLVLEWSEHGGPPVRRPERRGFGTRLLERGLAYRLGGEVSLVFAPEGLRCTITMPRPDAG